MRKVMHRHHLGKVVAGAAIGDHRHGGQSATSGERVSERWGFAPRRSRRPAAARWWSAELGQDQQPRSADRDEMKAPETRGGRFHMKRLEIQGAKGPERLSTPSLAGGSPDEVGEAADPHRAGDGATATGRPAVTKTVDLGGGRVTGTRHPARGAAAAQQGDGRAAAGGRKAEAGRGLKRTSRTPPAS